MRTDVVVLGAGIVGVSIALHLQKRGRSVLLVDRRKPGLETSFGNAGLIQREGVYPYGFPHDFGALLRYALNNTIGRPLPSGRAAEDRAFPVPVLDAFARRAARGDRPALCAADRALRDEHMALAEEAGATDLIRQNGWIKVFRTEKAMAERSRDAEKMKREFGVNFAALDTKGVAEEEPHLEADLVGGGALDRSGLGVRSARADDGLCRPFRGARRPAARRRCATLEATPAGLAHRDRGGSGRGGARS